MTDAERIEVSQLAEEVCVGGAICLLQFSHATNLHACIITSGVAASFPPRDLVLHSTYFDPSIREQDRSLVVATRVAVARWRTGELEHEWEKELGKRWQGSIFRATPVVA